VIQEFRGICVVPSFRGYPETSGSVCANQA
jgi:hypothetical protein